MGDVRSERISRASGWLVREDFAVTDVDNAVGVFGDIGLVGDEDDGVAPAWRSSKRAMISTPVLESRFPVGSSARMMEGLLTRARAMATRWRWPPESSLGLCIMRASRLTAVEGVFGARDALVGGRAVVDEGQLDVMQRGGAGEQVEGLEDEADFLVANAGELVVIELGDVVAVEPVLAAGGVSRQPMRFISVDLPEPEGPMMATYSLWRMRR